LGDWGHDVRHFDPAFTGRVRDRARGVFDPGRWLGVEVRGWRHVPPPPALFVSNHGGGTTTLDVWGFLVAWYGRFGLDRPLHPLGHDVLFASERLGRFFARLGVLRARRGAAEAALRDHRRDLLVYPGGDREAWRSYRERWRLQFAGRRGYARLALRTGVPVVPVASAGAHHTLLVLTSGHGLARRLPMHRVFRADILPVHVSLPWGLAIGPWPHLPWPTPLRYRIGPPVPWPAGARPGEEPDEACVVAYDEAVRAALQRGLDRLRAAFEGRRAGALAVPSRASWRLEGAGGGAPGVAAPGVGADSAGAQTGAAGSAGAGACSARTGAAAGVAPGAGPAGGAPAETGAGPAGGAPTGTGAASSPRRRGDRVAATRAL
jgi:1-acyl-sn-glycerol-3-phosphate acyltransferase